VVAEQHLVVYGAQILEERVNNGRMCAGLPRPTACRMELIEEGLRRMPPYSYTPAGGHDVAYSRRKAFMSGVAREVSI
jgi:hypothetical protein